jgi:hypothetical protein
MPEVVFVSMLEPKDGRRDELVEIHAQHPALRASLPAAGDIQTEPDWRGGRRPSFGALMA